jgi:FkbM family methyltransferase
MQLKSLFQLLGFRGKARHYLYEIMKYELGNDDVIQYAQWKHPGESIKKMSADLIAGYKKHINAGDFCIDIGAHTGDTTLPMAVAATKSGCVLALEPNPFVYHVLEKNVRLNAGIVNIKTIMAAAGVEEGFLEFEYSDSGFCNGGRHEGISAFRHGHAFKQKVFAVNLENELRGDYQDQLPRLSFVKIDTEGYDLYILRSIEGILREFMPVVKAEIFKKTDLNYRMELLSFFVNLGYRVNKIKDEPLVAGEELTKDNLTLDKHFDILAVPANSTDQSS